MRHKNTKMRFRTYLRERLWIGTNKRNKRESNKFISVCQPLDQIESHSIKSYHTLWYLSTLSIPSLSLTSPFFNWGTAFLHFHWIITFLKPLSSILSFEFFYILKIIVFNITNLCEPRESPTANKQKLFRLLSKELMT
jgi:hypothetical protein